MKTILSIFCFLLSAFGVYAQVPEMLLLSVNQAVAATCATGDTTNAWDNFLEGFQIGTTGYESNWVWRSTGTVANITVPYDTSSLTTYKPHGACDQAIQVTIPTDGTLTYAEAVLGGGITLASVQTDLYFCLYIITAPDSGEQYGIFGQSAGAGEAIANPIRLQNSSGTIRIYVAGSSNSGFVNLATGQWYTIKVSYDTARDVSGSSLTVWSNNSIVGSAQTFQRSSGLTSLGAIEMGAVSSLEANDSGSVVFDLLSIKTN